jgi:predicted RNase H-like nuclease (RuvC/YqgF family)
LQLADIQPLNETSTTARFVGGHKTGELDHQVFFGGGGRSAIGRQRVESMKPRDKNNAFADQQSELLELQRRLSTLTQALSEKAEENLDVRAELEQLKAEGAQNEKKLREAESELERLKQERQAQDELNVEFQRRISTLSVCLTELAELNAAALSAKLGESEATQMLNQNALLQSVGRQAVLGAADSGAVGSSSMGGGNNNNETHHSRSSSSVSLGSPATPQLLQDYQGEIARLKFRLKKRKAKMVQMQTTLGQHKDRADSASKSCTKYERELKRLNREAEESLAKELGKRRQIEQSMKMAQRRLGELEFLLEDKGAQPPLPPEPGSS